MPLPTYPRGWKLRFSALCFSLIVFMTSCTAAGERLPSMLPTAVLTRPTAGQPAGTLAVPPQPPTSTPPSKSLPTPPQVSTATSPGASGPRWETLAGGFPRPTDLDEIPDGSGRLAVLQQEGMIRIVGKDGKLQDQPYLDIRAKVDSREIEKGLLGLAFHPRFEQNGWFFVNYTDINGYSLVVRYIAARGSDRVDPATEKIVLQVKQTGYPNHKGGGVVFGPEGYLYLSLGDGGSAGDPQYHAQSLDTDLGKLLRVDINQGDPFAIPPGNPFAKGGGLAEIYAYGLRNPWRFSFDRATGDLYIADVGQDKYEEIDFIQAGSPGGLNFGWNYREGAHPFKGLPPLGLKLVDPVWEYGHDQGCSVIGGFVYRGKQIPALQGLYLYGDYCSGKVWGLKRDADGQWQNQLLFETGLAITAFGQDLDGVLYLLDGNAGQVMRLVSH